MLNKIRIEIERLEDEYNNISTSQDELELTQIQRVYDSKLIALNQKKQRREEIMKDIKVYENALSVLEKIEEIYEGDEEE